MRPIALSVALFALVAHAAAQDHHCDDEALSRAAVAMLDGAPSLDAALAQSGSDAPTARGGGSATILADALERWGDVACGSAQSDHGTFYVVAPRRGTLALEDTRLTFTLADGYREPELFLERTSGDIERIGLDHTRALDLAEIDVTRAEVARIQLLARGPRGVVPIAQRALRPPRHIASEGDLERAIDAVRSGRSLRRLRSNRLLARVAREHAEEVCRANVVSHELTPGESPDARARASGVDARVFGEVVARTSGDALGSLLASPSHHAVLIDRRFTDVGIGIHPAQGAHERADRPLSPRCVVALFAAFPRPIARVVRRTESARDRD